LYKYGYLTQTFLPIVRELDQHNQENIKIWQKCIEDQDSSNWLERFILNLNAAVKEDKDKILGLVNTSKNTSKQPFLDLNRRQLKILRYLQTIPTVKREDYVQMMDVSTMTAFRDLTDLVEKKLLRVEGRGRGTKYLLLNR
jgi:Fic family protein